MLALLAEQPCHGYDLIRQIENLFDGSYSPSPGVIYPTLNFLEEAELISGRVQGSKRLYAITEAGRTATAEQAVATGRRAHAHRSQQTRPARPRPPARDS